MKKTLLASAIAVSTFSGSVMAQNTLSRNQLAAQIDSMPTIYGILQYALTHDSFDGGPSSVSHFDNESVLGVTHDHQISPGTTGFFRVEIDELGANDKDNQQPFSIYQAYVGVRGDSFGQVWVGSSYDTYQRAVTEIAEYYEVASLSQEIDYTTGEGDLVQYMSPSFNGLSLWAAVQINGDDKANGKSYPFQVAAVYEMDGLELAAAVDSNDSKDGNNENTYGFRASYNKDAFRVTGEYHTRSDVQDNFGIIGYYSIGPNQFALSYELTDFDNGDKSDTITLQALHNISDHMYLYFEGYLGGGDDVYTYTDSLGNPAVTDQRSIAAVGAAYYF